MRVKATNFHKARQNAQVRSYSRMVQLMKFALPAAAVALVALIFLTGRERFLPTEAENLVNAAALGAGLRLENPRFAGVTSDGDPFVVTALSALPDGAKPDQVDLEAPKAELRLANGMVLNVESNAGEMLRASEHLTLEGDVVLTTSDGYRAETDRALIDLAERTADLPGAITATGPRGSIRADSLEIRQTGAERNTVTAIFRGRVRVNYTPAQ
ncbi:MAG: LPS export ABC transporter periplasmic protein LptC [Paracoccaceae bacterium]